VIAQQAAIELAGCDGADDISMPGSWCHPSTGCLQARRFSTTILIDIAVCAQLAAIFFNQPI
jgi:hypothetical protein